MAHYADLAGTPLIGGDTGGASDHRSPCPTMGDTPPTPTAPDPDGLAAALVADHVAHAEVAIVWLTRDGGQWRIAHANPNAINVLGTADLAEVRTTALTQRINRMRNVATGGLTRGELLDAIGVVAAHADEPTEQLAERLGPRYLARPFAAGGIAGIKLVARHGDLAAELRRNAEAVERIVAAYFEHANAEVFMKDIDGRYVIVNDQFRGAWQREGEELTGLTDFELLPAEDAERYVAEDRHVIATNTPLETEGVSDRSDGQHVFRVVKFPVHGPDGELVGVGGVATDVTEALRSRAALAVSEERFRLAFVHASEGMALVSLDSVILQVNDRGCEILGRSRDDIVGHSAAEFYHPDHQFSLDEWAAQVHDAGSTSTERVFAKPDGSAVYVRNSTAVVRDADGRPLHYVTMVSDETERRALELRARQAEKLEAVGQLAGGIAHDVNNLLGGILGYAELVKAAQTHPDVIHQCEQVIGAALRAADYTSRLLSFARPPDQMTERFDVHEIVDEVVQMLRHSADSAIEITSELGAPNAVVDGSPSQLHGALLNLGLNARDAISGAGSITIRTAAGRELVGAVRIEVGDTGIGIAPDRIDRVFDPFYTTKSDGRGTGLGLTSVLATVHQHRGTLTVDSEPGRGSTFAIELPVVARRHATPATGTSTSLPPGTQVLVVDDDDVVRYVVAESLRLAGCAVLEAADGVAAIDTIQAQPAPPDVVVFDLRMPRMGGDGLFQILQRRWPATATVLMTGFGGDEGAESIRERGVGAVLQKPFKGDELVAAIARCVRRI